jgi:hypothetical protein
MLARDLGADVKPRPPILHPYYITPVTGGWYVYRSIESGFKNIGLLIGLSEPDAVHETLNWLGTNTHP